MTSTPIHTTISPVNIAIIKYWGKKDTKLHIPLNSSLSFTLNMDDLKTTTSVVASTQFETSRIYLNGKEEDFENKRIQNVIELLQERSQAPWYLQAKQNGENFKLLIVSENNFPTAAGLASSASGYCCLVYTLAQLYQVEGDLSIIMRLGSGSACRSVYGGFVAWEMGDSHESSRAVQVAPESHWPDLQILIAVASSEKKAVSSSSGMQQSVATSKKLAHRAAEIVPKRMEEMKDAIAKKDFATVAQLAMLDSDSFHDCCADTDPPIYYMNDTSHFVVKIVNAYNKVKGVVSAGYTYDAGPNAVLFFENKQTAQEFLYLLLHLLPKSDSQSDKDYFKKQELISKESQDSDAQKQLITNVQKELGIEDSDLENKKGKLRYILHTSVGRGPEIINDHLIDYSTLDIIKH
jgi:diphosphomevalonate decarboxylase